MCCQSQCYLYVIEHLFASWKYTKHLTSTLEFSLQWTFDVRSLRGICIGLVQGAVGAIKRWGRPLHPVYYHIVRICMHGSDPCHAIYVWGFHLKGQRNAFAWSMLPKWQGSLTKKLARACIIFAWPIMPQNAGKYDGVMSREKCGRGTFGFSLPQQFE